MSSVCVVLVCLSWIKILKRGYEDGTSHISLWAWHPETSKEKRRNPAFCFRQHLKVSYGSLSSVSTVYLAFSLSLFLSFAVSKKKNWMRCDAKKKQKNKELKNCPLLQTSVKKIAHALWKDFNLFIFLKTRLSQIKYEDKWSCIFRLVFSFHRLRHSCVRERPPVCHRVPLPPTLQVFFSPSIFLFASERRCSCHHCLCMAEGWSMWKRKLTPEL